ncbi:MAG: hypothetical protein CL666_12235 [Balneola sp.]|nr:hypothetical protein [Balneola sp.]|tara:strand:- start:203613 stop:207014 length:3402 start_codon:yes stop_codon:yes gene_type:complete
MLGKKRYKLSKVWAFLFVLMGMGLTANAQMVTGTDTLFYDTETSSWDFYDFSHATAFGIDDTASFDADIRGSSNEGGSFGREYSPEVLENRLYLIGDGGLDTAVTVPEWVDGSPWVSDAWQANGGQPIVTDRLWAIYTQEGTYAIIEFTEIVSGNYYVFDYKYQSDGSRNFEEADFGGGSSGIVEGSATSSSGSGFDFSREETADNHDAGDYLVDFVFVNNEGVNFGNEGSGSIDSTGRRFLLLGEGSIDEVQEVPARTDAEPWVTVSYDATGYQPISVGQLWAVYTREGNYGVIEITDLPGGDFGSSFNFNYKYLDDGSRDFGGSGDTGDPIPDVITIAEARNLAPGELVTIKGIVTSANRIYSNIQQDTAGILTYTPSGENVSGDYFNAIENGDVAIGDSIRITAYREDFQGQKELLDFVDFNVFSRGNPLPQAELLTLDEFFASGDNYNPERIRVNDLSIPGSSIFESGRTYIAVENSTGNNIRFIVPQGNNLAGTEIPAVFEYEGIAGYSTAYSYGANQQLLGLEEFNIIEVEPPIPSDSTAAPNGSFEYSSLGEFMGESPGWFADFDADTGAMGTFEIIDTEFQDGEKALEVSINSVHPEADHWSIQVVNEKFNLVPGNQYELSFWAKSAQSGAVIGGFIQNQDYGNFGTIAQEELSTSWTEYKTTFVANSGDTISTDDSIGRVAIYLNYEANEGKQIYIDNLQVNEIESGPIEGDLYDGALTGAEGQSYFLPLNIELLNGVPLDAFEIKVNFDLSFTEVSLGEQEGTHADYFDIETNSPEPGVLLISGATANGITESGPLMYLEITALSSGTGSIEITDVFFNETSINDASISLDFETGFVCGDVTGDLNVSATDASYVLRHTVKLSPQYPLTGQDSTAADVTGNGWISAYDASQILKYNVGMPAIMNCASAQAKMAPLAVQVDWDYWSEGDEGSEYSVPLSLNDLEGALTAAEIQIPMTEGLKFKGINNAPENWQVTTNVRDGVAYVSMFGAETVESELLGELAFELIDKTEVQNIEGRIVVNENPPVQLEKLTLNDLPREFKVSQNYPNPFNPTTQIKYSVPEDAKVQLFVYNLLGQKVAELVNEQKSPGRYTVSWDAGNNSSGVYMYRLVAGENVFTKKMMLIK